MKYKNLLFDEEETKLRLAGAITLKAEYDIMNDSIDHLLRKMETCETDLSHDLTAAEEPYFQTLNYTTFSKCLMISPLQPDLAYQQIYDAIIDNEDDGIDYVKYFADIVKNNNANKYEELTAKTDYACEALVVLPGSNKLFSHVCMNKIKYILKEHGKLAVFKPHPLTHEEDLEKLKKDLGNISKLMTFLDRYDDLYYYMDKANIVYTTHFSESVLYARCMGKEVSPIDTFQTRQFNSFSHLNNILFMNNDPLIINKIFSSSKSGIVLPDIQKDCNLRINNYVDYIHKLRKRIRYYYV